jgi:hypothetical protein
MLGGVAAPPSNHFAKYVVALFSPFFVSFFDASAVLQWACPLLLVDAELGANLLSS